MPGQSARRQIDEQRASNLSAVAYFEHFAGHRARLTELVAERAPPKAAPRLCVLGAGNCHDLELAELGRLYGELHLVDIDAAALERAKSRQSPELQERIACHAPLDLSGVLDHIERWKRMETTVQELIAIPDAASGKIAQALPGAFDVVVSACILTQMQLSVLDVLGDRHPLFEAVRQTVNLIHLRTLAKLLAPGGKGLLVTDVASNLTYPLERAAGTKDLKPLLAELVGAGNVIYAAHPGQLGRMWADDPFLRRTGSLSSPIEAWLWHNGPERIFLVYACEITKPP